MTLDELAVRAKQGDRQALEELVRAVQDRLYNLSVRILGDREHARDATQEILILLITQLSQFRGESSLMTWAHRVATRHLLRQKQRVRAWTFQSLADENLGKPPNAIDRRALEHAEERVLEEQVFIGCTQAMLQALDKDLRVAFVLGAICELDGPEAAYVLGISETAFRKRLSRARAALDAFLGKQCGVASVANLCRCKYQVNHNVKLGRIDPARLDYAVSTRNTSLEVLRALGEIDATRRSLQIYRAQPSFVPTEDFAKAVRALIAEASWS
jgi:RNA polymerase sigma factor (sigma-70 family)